MELKWEDREVLRDMIICSENLIEAQHGMGAFDIELQLVLFGDKMNALSDEFMCNFFAFWWEGHSIYDTLISTYLDAFDDIDWARHIRPRLETFSTHLRNVVG